MNSSKRAIKRQEQGYIHQAKRMIEKGVRPKELRDDGKLDSATLNEAQSKWLDKRLSMLVVLLDVENKRELERRKAVARRSGNLRQTRILENGFEFYTVTQVLVLYGKNCHICHDPIDLKASRRVGMGDWLLGLHIDHVLAIALGGPDTLENVRPSHAICNLKKGITII